MEKFQELSAFFVFFNSYIIKVKNINVQNIQLNGSRMPEYSKNWVESCFERNSNFKYHSEIIYF